MKYIFTIVALCGVLLAHAQNYYVGGTGASDSNPGTAGSPFATINKAATVAVPGSTVYIRTGTYRETITPTASGTSGSPITFKPDGGSMVTISGLNDVGTTGWTVHAGSIYKKTITLPIASYGGTTNTNTALLANQVFKDGEMQFEASSRSLSTVEDLFDITKWKALPSGFNATSLTDAALSGLNLTGGKIVSLGWFWSLSKQITSQTGNTINYDALDSDQKFRKYYFVIGKLSLLNQAKEWFYDGAGTLYYQQPGGGSPTGLEYKARNWGFDLSGKSYINVVGLSFKGCEPVMGNASTNYITVDNIRATYTNHSITHETAVWQGYGNAKQTGIGLRGVGNTIKNSELTYGGSQGIWIGAGGTVQNNKIQYYGYDGMWGAGVSFWGTQDISNITVSNNTIAHMGRGCIDNGYTTAQDQAVPPRTRNNRITMNDLSYWSHLNQDAGAFYAWGWQDVSGGRIDHNWIHDNAMVPYPVANPSDGTHSDGISAGLYFDMGSGPDVGQPTLIVDHNIFWNNSTNVVFGGTEMADYYTLPIYEEGQSGQPAKGRKQPAKIYNNTFWGEKKSYVTYQGAVADIMRNNILRNELNWNWNSVAYPSIADIDFSFVKVGQTYPPGYSVSSHVVDYNPQLNGGSLTTPATYFGLQSGSLAKDVGTSLPGITTDAVGTPDIGAYESGAAAWTAGYVAVAFPAANTPPTVNAGPDNSISLPVTSIVLNGTASDVEGPITAYLWTKQSGPSATLTNATTQNLTASGLSAGTYVFRLTATDNNGATGYDEVTLVVNASGTNIALNKPVTVSSLEAPQYTGNLAVDGNAGTRWSSLFADPQWIYVDLQAVYSINRVKITWNVGYGANYKIEVANSSSGPWTAISTVTGNTVLTNDLTGLSGAGRYVRMYGTVRGSNWGYSIYELEVYGTPSNIAPTANAGVDQNVTGSSVVINGSGTDPDGTIASYAWTRISGPNTPTLTGANTANLTINGLIAGTYVYRLTVTDNGGLTGTDDVSVIVTTGTNLALNKPTTVSSVESGLYPGSFAVDGNAGTRWSSAFADPQWLYVDLQANYNIQRVKITWDVAYASNFKVEVANSTSGPWTAISTITGNTSMTNDLTGLSGAGRYLRVYGTARATGWGYSFFELEVYGTPAANIPPTANAGPDKAVYTSSVVINGSGTDSDGTIASYAWTRISGPNTPTLSGATTANLTVSGLVAGTYVYRLTVTDNGGLTATDDVSILSSVNLALSKPTTVSSVEAAQYAGNFAVDGNAGTRWSSAFSDPQWLYVDLQATYTIQRVKITWDVAYASNFKVEVATASAGPWTAISTITGNTSMSNDLTGLSGVGRYVRVYGTARATNWGYSFFELEVYGISFGGGRVAMDVTPEPDPKAEATYLFKLFPNPVNMNESVNLELSTVPGDLAVFDLIGRKQYEEHVIDHYVEIPAFKLGTGLYFFKYTADGHTDLRKVMIK